KPPLNRPAEPKRLAACREGATGELTAGWRVSFPNSVLERDSMLFALFSDTFFRFNSNERNSQGSCMHVLITAEQIQERLAELARHIGLEYRDRPLHIVGVLTGSLMFLADFVRRLDMPLRIGLIQASSYRGKTTNAGQLHIGPDLLADVCGRHVLLL